MKTITTFIDREIQAIDIAIQQIEKDNVEREYKQEAENKKSGELLDKRDALIAAKIKLGE